MWCVQRRKGVLLLDRLLGLEEWQRVLLEAVGRVERYVCECTSVYPALDSTAQVLIYFFSPNTVH